MKKDDSTAEKFLSLAEKYNVAADKIVGLTQKINSFGAVEFANNLVQVSEAHGYETAIEMLRSKAVDVEPFGVGVIFHQDLQEAAKYLEKHNPFVPHPIQDDPPR